MLAAIRRRTKARTEKPVERKKVKWFFFMPLWKNH
jgi:hypothetical protein